jgi:hypothetical protein
MNQINAIHYVKIKRKNRNAMQKYNIPILNRCITKHIRIMS